MLASRHVFDPTAVLRTSSSSARRRTATISDVVVPLIRPGVLGGHPLRKTGIERQQHRKRACRVSASAGGRPSTYIGSLSSTGLKFGIVAARFNELVTKPLLEGVLEGLERHGTSRDTVDVAWVPGSFELPLIAKAMAKSGKYDAVITVGAVVRGATAHFDAVVSGATSGVLNAALDSGVPVIFCVMTTDTMEQALDRAGGKSGNKGFEAAVTAIETANVLKALGQQGLAKARDAW
ncbi:6,7-dimethyl-8-ribityllumazine synthase [Coccomyxa sp. Obi]|nr:6,7-dimethyl-8-ribityllumazine synthase [Coccomyxa sp. Obi]